MQVLAAKHGMQVAVPVARIVACVCTTADGRRTAASAGAGTAIALRLAEAGAAPKVSWMLCETLVRLFREPVAADAALARGPALGTMFRIYLCGVSRPLSRVAYRALRALACGSPARRAKVLFAIGYLLRTATGFLATRLVFIRRAVLEQPVADRSAHQGADTVTRWAA